MKCIDCAYVCTEDNGRSVCENIFSKRSDEQVWLDGKCGCDEGLEDE